MNTKGSLKTQVALCCANSKWLIPWFTNRYPNVWPQRSGLRQHALCRSVAVIQFLYIPNAGQELIWSSLGHVLRKDRAWIFPLHCKYTPLLEKLDKTRCSASGLVVKERRRASTSYFRMDEFSGHALYKVLVNQAFSLIPVFMSIQRDFSRAKTQVPFQHTREELS